MVLPNQAPVIKVSLQVSDQELINIGREGIKDTNGDTIGTDLVGNMTLDVNGISLNTYALQIGCISNSGTPLWFYDGLMDELVVFDDVITASEATQIAQGTYGAGLSIPVAMNQYRQRWA